MATYYRWRKSELVVKEETSDQGTKTYTGISQNYIYGTPAGPDVPIVNGYYDFSDATKINLPSEGDYIHRFNYNFAFEKQADFYVYQGSGSADVWNDGDGQIRFTVATESRLIKSAGTFIGYVYSTSSSAYPNGGVQDGYYYDQRTTVTSPTAPANLQYPNPITTPTVTVSWQAATSNTDYPVTGYNLYYGKNGDESTTNIVYPQNNPNTSAEVQIPSDATSIRFWVGARDSNGNVTVSEFGPWVSVYLAPTLTVPQMVMQGQQATINWSAIEGADSYTLQRKANTDTDWTQVYSGTALTFSETVGTWTSLQYRVQAVFDGTPGGWATSNSIQIVSASSLVISGQDGDLGTLTSDVPYSISSDQTGTTIDVTVEVNGGEYASFQATSGQTYKVSVLDLPTGTGNITITATTEVSSSPVTVTRNWTYSKTAHTFPNSGSVAALTKEGNVVYPETLPEAVRTPMNPWGGNLSTALNHLKNAALFNRTKHAKYSEVIISMANVTEGQIISIPRGGVMTPHYVGKLEYESGLNGAGRRLMVPVECYNKRQWNTTDVATYATSAIDSWMNGEYKALFPEEIQTAMGTTKFYYTQNAVSDVTTLERSVFALSANELGKSAVWFNAEGSVLPIASALQIAKYNGSAIEQWTRTPTNNALTAVCLLSNGNANGNYCTDALGSRPCFTLPSTYTYGPVYVDQDGNIHDQQEYTEAGNWLDVWGNVIPAIRIETGSYVGTGTSGSSNPNTLTFGFEPKLLMVAANNTGLAFNLYSSDIAWSASFIWFSGVTGMTMWNNPGVANLNVSVQGNKISWYSTSARSQCNEIMTTYAYLAIG